MNNQYNAVDILHPGQGIPMILSKGQCASNNHKLNTQIIQSIPPLTIRKKFIKIVHLRNG